MNYRQWHATMINNNGIDSWKTEPDFNGFLRREFDLFDHHANTGEDATLTRVKNSSSGPEIRYINPAIYTESVDEEESKNDREQDLGSSLTLFIIKNVILTLK